MDNKENKEKIQERKISKVQETFWNIANNEKCKDMQKEPSIE